MFDIPALILCGALIIVAILLFSTQYCYVYFKPLPLTLPILGGVYEYKTVCTEVFGTSFLTILKTLDLKLILYFNNFLKFLIKF